MLTNRECVDWAWHHKIEDNLSWSFCCGIIKMNTDITISPQRLEKNFIAFFKELTGVEPYTECPECKNKLLPRKSRFGYFVGCSNFPECRYIAKPKSTKI